MFPSNPQQYAAAKKSWVVAFEYQEQHAGMKVRTDLTRALANVYRLSSDKTRIICDCVERFNTASLIHDDIIDQDRIRRGADSVWVRYGVAAALISGMYGYIQGLKSLSESGRMTLVQAGLDSLEELHIGQYLDTLLSEGADLPTMEQYRYVAQLNTGCFFIFILRACQQLKPLPQQCYRSLKSMLLELAVYYRFVNDYCDINHIPHYAKKGFAPDLEAGPKSFLMIIANQPLPKSNRSEIQKRQIIINWGNADVFCKALKIMEDSYAILPGFLQRAQQQCNELDFSQLHKFLDTVHFQQKPADDFYASLQLNT
ncbi:polyprenyl synthetase family protein [Pseudomonas fluorescens]|uniref:Uncharacterized protein n=1 Tax=Pseudomonas fluorescens TaxID=294 RepID=A0A5E6XEW4_PSEFL|nr:polyprenyl synthetase family protein [Pseudomonas fluorescens]VVN39334.1 hypothetical protein PS655_05340 [Pseudomonas fluorescens]